MLRTIDLENYRAFESECFHLSKVNLFFGPNNAGKSAALSSVNLLAQTLESADPYAAVLLRGKFEDLGSYRDMVHGNDARKRVKISIGLDVSDIEMRRAIHRRGARLEDVSRPGEFTVVFAYQTKRRRIVVGGSTIRVGGETILATRLAKGGETQVLETVADRFREISSGRLSRLIGLNHFLPTVELPFARRWRQGDVSTAFNLGYEVNRFNRSAKKLLDGVEFIGPFRSKAQRVYALSGESPSTVGVHGEKAVDVLISDYLARGKRTREISERVSAWLRNAELGEVMQPRILSPRHVEIQVSHLYSGELQNLADVGYGCSQILPILVAGFSRPVGSTLIVQQPEIHLHPKAQAALGDFVCDVAERGVQLLIETHSEHLLLRLQSHVASGRLPAQDVAVHYVYANKEKHKKTAKLLPLGDDGLFKEKWPEGFFPERLIEAKRVAGFKVD